MILIDRLVSFSREQGLAEVTLRADHPFASPDGVPAHLGIELMAQTCGAMTGAWSKSEETPVRVGFLLGTRNFEAKRPFFPLGARLHVAVTLFVRDAEMAVFDCSITQDDELLAEARLNLYQPGSDEAVRSILTRAT